MTRNHPGYLGGSPIKLSNVPYKWTPRTYRPECGFRNTRDSTPS
ncbi:hypothetical protein CPAR01_08732 [Colletotrichum paranaense]|uniref:Uncharacterized protein n=3 Tax=Colletotrichum acutatum species complex TaxID=2707335 RepID=A0AAI9XL10_9PEZI|nr:uncharacterized protein CPAR01_08732 [Colletotrichum paranaense]KAK0373098.1 hypothetical protein CLIM01_09548 [Colletotrichum limetticola]KAK1454153.1 hypothetical protein CMEL01_05812 [Colletotrichum melonis]KAK1538619.1 hypothetical protein CPAR01_08732 [Colletotrichum paranaense]